VTTATPDEARSQIVNLVRDFVKRDVEPVAAQLDKEDIVPHDLIDKMKDLGLFGITVPEEYGGLGLDYTTFATIFEELSKGLMSISGAIGTHHILTYVLTHYGTEDQRQRFLPDLASGRKRGGLALTEPGGGSDVANLQTTAEKDGEEYVINGTKMFITNGRYGDAFCLLARTDQTAEPRHRGISAFVVEKGAPGLQVNPQHGKMGMRASSTNEVVFQDTPVPAENLLGEEGRGFRYAMEILDSSRIIIAAQCVGIGQAALEEAVRYAQQRQSFGKPIAQHQAIQFLLADMATEVHAARVATMQAATLKDEGLPFINEASMAKLLASEMCVRVTSQALQVHGGYGYFKDSPVERLFRDARVTTIYEGTSEVQRLVIARQVLAQYQV